MSKEPTQNGKGSLVHASFKGPLPPPDLFAQYDVIIPGAAERLLKMAEENSQHQIAMEKSALSATRWEVHVGQSFALIVVLAAFATSAWFATTGHPTEGALLGGATLATVVIAFIKGRSSNQ